MFLGAIVFVSCKKQLDLKPAAQIPTEIALSNADNLETATIGAYSALASNNLYNGRLRIYGDIMTDHTVSYTSARENNIYFLYDIFRRLFYRGGDNIWSSAYQAINSANNVLSAIDRLEPSMTNDVNFQNNKARLRGECYFIRGLMHFELVRFFGLQYGLADPAKGSQSGIVLRLSPSEGREGTPRASVNEVYAQVIEDLKKAANLMPDDVDPNGKFPRSYGGKIGGRATKDAALAMLARVYFQKGTPEDNDSALIYINQVLGNTIGPSAKYPLDPFPANAANLFENHIYMTTGYNKNSETIFQVNNQYQVNGTTLLLDNPGQYLASCYVELGNNYPFFVTSRACINYDCWPAIRNSSLQYIWDKSVDQRYLAFAGPPAGKLIDKNYNFWVAKYNYKTIQGFNQNIGVRNNNVIRAGELHVTRAQIFAEKGQTANAQTELLVTIRRACIPNPNGGAQTPDQYIAAQWNAVPPDSLYAQIRAERCRELFFEGDRLHSMRRNYYYDTKNGGRNYPRTRYIITSGNGNPKTAPGNEGGDADRNIANISPIDQNLLLQIPDQELLSNSAIRANPIPGILQ